MNLKLPDTVFSSQDLNGLILEIHEYTKWLQHESIKQRVNASKSSDHPVLTTAASDLIRQSNDGKDPSRAQLEDLIQTLKNYKDKAPSITVTLAAPPTVSVKRTLVTWLRENITPNVLVNFQFNSTLLGGMVVRSGSHIFDWSFRRQILENRDKFPEVLRNV